MIKDVFEEFTIDLVTNCNLNMFTARKIVTFLRGEGIIDFDILRKYYSEEEAE